MVLTNTYRTTFTTYPGEYMPLPDSLEELMEELCKPHEGATDPSVNICEMPDYFKIEIATPGFKKEDFFITIKDKALNISALHKPYTPADEHYFLHSFNYECFKRDIILPDNIDTDFIRAEYKDGILSVWFSRANYPTENKLSQIIVY